MLKKLYFFIKTHKKYIAIIVIILAILTFIFRPKTTSKIETVAVKRNNLVQTLSSTGTVDSETAVNLSFISSGQLVYLGAKLGDSVKKGEVIASLDQRTLERNLETTLRTYSEQRNTFEQTIQNNNPNLTLDSQTQAIKRILQNNQYDLDKAVLSVELQDLAKQQSVLVSPIDGIIVREDAQMTGINVSPTTIFSIADPADMNVKVDVDEADIGKVGLQQIMQVTLDAYPNKILKLPVSHIDFASHTTSTGGIAYTIEGKLPENSNFQYRIGMQADAQIITAERPHTLTIPLSSIVDDTDVYVQFGKKFVKRKIILGIQNDTDAEVISGINTGDVIATVPSEIQK